MKCQKLKALNYANNYVDCDMFGQSLTKFEGKPLHWSNSQRENGQKANLLGAANKPKTKQNETKRNEPNGSGVQTTNGG